VQKLKLWSFLSGEDKLNKTRKAGTGRKVSKLVLLVRISRHIRGRESLGRSISIYFLLFWLVLYN